MYPLKPPPYELLLLCLLILLLSFIPDLMDTHTTDFFMSDNIFERQLTCFFFELLPIHSDSKQLFREMIHDLKQTLTLYLHVFFFAIFLKL